MNPAYGPNPWQQTSWDARAACNFVFGGVGAGLIVFAVLFGAGGLALKGLVLAGLALVGLGLFCVWTEIGRPLRALHVFINPRSSWMTREALSATLLFPTGLAAAAAVPGFAWVAAGLALAFVYCQGRMLQAAKGIPAWREPLVVPLIVVTAVAEGGGVFFVAAPLGGGGTPPLDALLGAMLLLRVLLWFAYRRRLAGTVAPPARVALDAAGRLLQLAGTLAPLVLIALVASGAASGAAAAALMAIAGLAAALGGAYVKYALVTRAGFNQGFMLARLPVRGSR